jgi:hypothetical protein
MNSPEARAYLNYLLTLSLRQEDAFGPLALTFMREHDLGALGLEVDEQFNLYYATAQAFVAEPKRYAQKLECLRRARELVPQMRYDDPELAQQLEYDIKKTHAELTLYNEAMKVPRAQGLTHQRLVVETDVPGYFLDLAQKRAAAYYQNKYRVSKEAKTAQQFPGPPKKFDPHNVAIQKEMPGSCPPFMTARTHAFHMMLPFDLKISKKPDDPLEGAIRIFYGKAGYSYPLRYEMGKLCGYHDGQVQDIALDDPHLLFVSASPVKDPEFLNIQPQTTGNVPPELAYPQAVLEHTVSLGVLVQLACNFKIWFDASVISLLVLGAPDLYEYGLQGAIGVMTRTHGSDKLDAYVESTSEAWQQGLSYNFVNLHLGLSPNADTALVPFNTPIFTVFPVLNRQNYTFEDRHKLGA